MGDTTCWALTNSDGEDLDQDGVPHFPSEKHAEEEAARIEGDEVFKPRQLDHLCVTVTCTCCKVTYDDEGEGVCHFDDMAEAEKTLRECGWKLTREETLCEYCKDGPCDQERGDHG